ncbi:MAG TPA: nitrilase-related carbon-nitrogen hydrolase [Clostridia bacterium]|nr:nitrilase-related carbon-nitrogen hydrolase [Clostridia bacterium]
MNLTWILKPLVKVAAIKNSPKRIRAYIDGLGIKPADNISKDNTQDIHKESIRVCAVQEEIRLLKNHRQYTDRMHGFIKEAADRGAQLVTFPEENGTLILGMLPFMGTALKLLNRFTGTKKSEDRDKAQRIRPKRIPEKAQADAYKEGKAEKKNQGKARAPLDIAKILAPLSSFLVDVFETTFSELAKAYGVYIMAGSMVLEDGGKVYNRAYLFGPEGNIIGTQDKTHLVELEMGMGLSMGSNLSVYKTDIGRLAFPVCMDATYFETFKILKDQGAQVVIIPIANMEEYNYYFALRGIWPRVQESGVYGIKPALVGNLFGLKFTGKAGIYAPINMTPEMDGVLGEAGTYNRDELIICDLDLKAIDEYRDEYFSDENLRFFKRHFPRVYANKEA